MRKIGKKAGIIFAAISVIGILGVFSCNKQGGKSGADTTKRENLVFFLMGDPPNDMTLVQGEVSKRLTEKINASMTFNFSSWTDWGTKYNMVLSSGEPCDLIYAANWMNYSALAGNDAFVPLDDLLPEYAPDIWNLIPQSTWNQMRIKGKIYAVPLSKNEYGTGGVLYREDLREKYGLPKPDTLANVESFARGIKQKDPAQIIFGNAVNTSSFGVMFGAVSVLGLKYSWAHDPVYGIVADYANPSNAYDYWSTQDFRDDMKMFKRWADAGFWSRSVLSDSNDSDSFGSGKCVINVDGLNPPKYIGTVEAFKKDHPDWSANYITFASVNGVAFANSPTANATAIPVNSKNPERAMMALNLLYTDKEIHRLIMYGIEGTHYEIDAEGFYKEIPDTQYAYESANTWGIRNPQIGLVGKSDEALSKVFEELHQIALKTKTPDVDIASGFIEDYSSYAAERAALSTVLVQYLAPIQAGLVSDVDAAIDEFLQKAKTAGLEKIQASYLKQWKEYCEQYGY